MLISPEGWSIIEPLEPLLRQRNFSESQRQAALAKYNHVVYNVKNARRARLGPSIRLAPGASRLPETPSLRAWGPGWSLSRRPVVSSEHALNGYRVEERCNAMTELKSPSDAELVERLAHLPVERDTAEHYRGYLRRQLLMNRCGDCDRWHHPMRPMCPACWSWNILPTAVNGRGTVHLFLALHQGPSAQGVAYSQGPHPVVTVELEEQDGLRFTGTIVDCKVADVRIGMPVEISWLERNGSPYPAFRPAAVDRDT